MKKLIFIPFIFIATACSSYVEEKVHVPEYNRVEEKCVTYGNRGCSQEKDITVKIPECYQLVLDTEWGREKICVDKDTWNNTYIGQEWK